MTIALAPSRGGGDPDDAGAAGPGCAGSAGHHRVELLFAALGWVLLQSGRTP
jgi:hypothetical protein